MESQASPLAVMCEVCGMYFETRRGLSSHARLHLRQLGVTLSESSGAPIELLYQLIQERDGALPDFKAGSSALGLTPLKKTSTPQKMHHQGSSSARLKEPATSLLSSSPSALRLVESRASEGSTSSSLGHRTPTKPLWAPLETDAPITLDTTKDEVHVCQLCGCWYASRKGLTSHARAHLRHIGLPDSEIKGSPIDLLYKIMEEEDLEPIGREQQEKPTPNSPPRPSSKRTHSLSSPVASTPIKRPKGDCTCILCGEEFENRKGLACHARCHLRQMGVFDLMGKSSAIETLQELISSGMIDPAHFTKGNRKKNSSTVSSPAPASPALSPATGQSRTLFLSTSLSPTTLKCTSQIPANKAPKAKKGFRLAVDPLHRKPKPEPEEFEVSDQPKGSSTNIDSPMPKPSAAVASKPVNAVSSTHFQSPPTVLCDYCGQLFETRKALSCHARAHLRQLGMSWSIKTSPIDLLREVMTYGEEARKESAPSGSSGKPTWAPQGSRKSVDSLHSEEPAPKACTTPVDYSMKEKSPPGKTVASHTDISCELCGFEFENRKALASHARAHLRQLGVVEWKSDGTRSPIELLSELIRRDPAKVTAITQRYRRGDLYIKKSGRVAASSSLSTDSEPGSSQRHLLLHHEHKRSREELAGSAGSSRHSQGPTRNSATHSEPSVRSPRGVHPPKHAASAREENRNTNSQQPSRSGSIPAMLPKPPLTPLVKLMGKVYSLKCRFCEEVFHGPPSVQEKWIRHLQKHILSLGYKGKACPPPAPPAATAAPALLQPVAV